MLRFRRVGTSFVAGVYFLTNVAVTHAVEKSLWEERRAALDRAPRYARLFSPAQAPMAWTHIPFDGGSTPSQPPSTLLKHLAFPFDVASAVLPYGAIGEVQEGRRGAPVVFLVQDVHGNDGAQKNIGGLLGELSSRGVTLTGVEGAWVPIDLAAFHRHPSPQAVSLVADALRATGRLTGSEWAGLTAPHPPTLVGVESPDLYHANVAAARECVAKRPDVATFLNKLDNTFQIHKDRFYSPDLKTFDLHIRDYHAGREGLAEYTRFLSGLPRAGALSGEQVKIFLKAIDWESLLNFEKVEADRRALMDRLARYLGRRELDALLSQAVAYRAGKQTNGDFFSYLKTLCSKSHIPLASYPSFADYISYVGVVQSINRADLLRELPTWEEGLAASLAHTSEERRLVAMDRDVSLLRQLLENEMSPESWAQFNVRRNEIVSLPARLREFGDFKEPAEGLPAFFRSHEEFCRLAMERNGALVSNFMRQVESSKAAQAVLITGGFHTPGLQSELSKRGCSTVVVTPRIEKVEGKPLDVFARDPLPFDQLFAGKPISLSPELMLGNPAGRALMKLIIDVEGKVLTNHSIVKIRGSGMVVIAGPSNSVSKEKNSQTSTVQNILLANGHSIQCFTSPPIRGPLWPRVILVVKKFVGWLLVAMTVGVKMVEKLLGLNGFNLDPRAMVLPAFNDRDIWSYFWSGGGTINPSADPNVIKYFQEFADNVWNLNPPGYVPLILDIGGGAGDLGRMIKNNQVEIVIFDIAADRVSTNKDELCFVTGSGVALPFKEKSFDGLMDVYSLNYRPDLEQNIREMFRVLKDGGKAAILLHFGGSFLVQNARDIQNELDGAGFGDKTLSLMEEFVRPSTSESRKKKIREILNALDHELFRVSESAIPGAIPTLINAQSLIRYVLSGRPPFPDFRFFNAVNRLLLESVDKLPENVDQISELFTRVGFTVEKTEYLEAKKNSRYSTTKHIGLAISLAKHKFKRIQFHFSRQGLAVRVSLMDSSGKGVASAIVSGKRGEIVIQNISIEPGESNYAYDLIAGAVKEFLLMKGQGRVLLCGVKDPRIKQAARALFGENLVLAPKKFGRSLAHGPLTDAFDPTSDDFSRLLNDPNAEVDLAGSLTPEARQALWPNEELPELVTAKTPAPASYVNFIPVKDQNRITENLPPGFPENDLYDVEIDGTVVGTAIFSETPLGLWMSDLNIRVEHRQHGYARAVYRSLAKKAALILSPEQNKNGPVPFKGINIANPIAFKIRGELCEWDSIEIVESGSEYSPLVADWTKSLRAGSEQFYDLVGPSNIDTEGPNKGKYKRHFDFRGNPKRSIVHEAEGKCLQAQLVNPIGALSSRHPTVNGFALLGVGVPFDPLIGLTVAAIFLGAMLFKDKIMVWLGGVVSPSFVAWADQKIPDFSRYRQAIWTFTVTALLFIGTLLRQSSNGTVLVSGVRERMHIQPAGNSQTSIQASQRKVSDSLTEEERGILKEALVGATPSCKEMGGVELLIDPHQISLPASLSGATVEPELGRAEISALEKSVTERLTHPTSNAISWAGDLALQTLAQEALRGAAEKAIQHGDAQVAGAALAALDDGVRYPHGPDPEKMKETILALNQSRTGSLMDTANAFADSYNQMQSGLLHRRLLGAQLGGAGILLDLTALFEAGDSPAIKAKKEQTWAALAGVLVANRQNPEIPVGLVVRDASISRSRVEAELKKMVPSWEKGRVGGNVLILAGEKKSHLFFNGAKFSLKSLRTSRPVWQLSLRLVGFDLISLAETNLKDLGVIELVPLIDPLKTELEYIIRKLKFIRVSA